MGGSSSGTHPVLTWMLEILWIHRKVDRPVTPVR